MFLLMAVTLRLLEATKIRAVADMVIQLGGVVILS
jgi:hypothetical protein